MTNPKDELPKSVKDVVEKEDDKGAVAAGMSEDALQRAIFEKAENRGLDDWIGIAKEAWSAVHRLQEELGKVTADAVLRTCIIDGQGERILELQAQAAAMRAALVFNRDIEGLPGGGMSLQDYIAWNELRDKALSGDHGRELLEWCKAVLAWDCGNPNGYPEPPELLKEAAKGG